MEQTYVRRRKVSLDFTNNSDDKRAFCKFHKSDSTLTVACSKKKKTLPKSSLYNFVESNLNV